jgi:YidC/Oxa1 family membrane protein insertase
MEKRLLIAFVLSMAVLVVYGLFVPQKRPTVGTTQQTGEVKPASPASAENKGQTPAEERAKTEQPENTETTPSKTPHHKIESGLQERLVHVNTGLVSAVISSKGGVIKSWKLKKYKDEEGNPLEMVQYEDGVMPLLVVPEGMTSEEASSMDYSIEGGDIDIDEKGEAGLTLISQTKDGRKITKRLLFHGNSYRFDVDVSGIDEYNIFTGENFGSLTTKKKKGYGYTGPLVYIDGKMLNRGFKVWVHNLLNKSKEAKQQEKTYEGNKGWAAITDQYFVAGIIPKGPIKVEVEKGMSDWGYVGIHVDQKTGPLNAIFYAGPKEYDRLKAIGNDFQQAVDFGWFSFIAKPLFVALKFFHGLVGNYGWSIIIITFIIKLAFAPLTHKQQKSMKRMQKLQPKIVELKEKYKGDSQRMNAEMMELYKREKVNPLGGCLPMLIQVPVFIALYKVLYNAIELRGAPFMWWLSDLSAKDPYYILPILMGVSMFVMQRMTPTTADATQNKIMMIMPVVLTFMFINLPSGLVLYFTVSNLLSMAQQLYINRTVEA